MSEPETKKITISLSSDSVQITRLVLEEGKLNLTLTAEIDQAGLADALAASLPVLSGHQAPAPEVDSATPEGRVSEELALSTPDGAMPVEEPALPGESVVEPPILDTPESVALEPESLSAQEPELSPLESDEEENEFVPLSFDNPPAPEAEVAEEAAPELEEAIAPQADLDLDSDEPVSDSSVDEWDQEPSLALEGVSEEPPSAEADVPPTSEGEPLPALAVDSPVGDASAEEDAASDAPQEQAPLESVPDDYNELESLVQEEMEPEEQDKPETPEIPLTLDETTQMDVFEPVQLEEESAPAEVSTPRVASALIQDDARFNHPVDEKTVQDAAEAPLTPLGADLPGREHEAGGQWNPEDTVFTKPLSVSDEAYMKRVLVQETSKGTEKPPKGASASAPAPEAEMPANQPETPSIRDTTPLPEIDPSLVTQSAPREEGDRPKRTAARTKESYIRFTCRRCNTVGHLRSDKVGSIVTCKNCHKAMRLALKK